ncbi:hypothetical protein BVC80_9047g5 [Macleaya cordata]|uniref:Uncharacterized protein n=1 Tax=Macleaya cordata TaxID=56857 RepID=A0A200R2W5_MACCD|nr:hypothetical protein BVC80_9047g5 [Macleaya cordata]
MEITNFNGIGFGFGFGVGSGFGIGWGFGGMPCRSGFRPWRFMGLGVGFGCGVGFGYGKGFGTGYGIQYWSFEVKFRGTDFNSSKGDNDQH